MRVRRRRGMNKDPINAAGSVAVWVTMLHMLKGPERRKAKLERIRVRKTGMSGSKAGSTKGDAEVGKGGILAL